MRFALERFDRPTWAWRLARLAGHVGLGPAVLKRRFPVGAAGRHAERLLAQLHDLTGEPGPFVAHVGAGEDLVVFALRGSEPSEAAKVSTNPARLAREAHALRTVGESARAAGAYVPEPLAAHEVDAVGVLVETVVPGRPLVWTGGGRRAVPRIVERLADWLAAWHRLTARPVELTRELLAAELLAPAKFVADALDDGRAYLRKLEGLARRAEGKPISLVAAHCDLTSSNVLTERDRLAIVDWEHARADGLPLTDFFYAAADLVAILGRHGDRLRALEDCFGRGGPQSQLVEPLERRLRDVVDLSDEAADVCFHACWARHGANELRAAGGRPGVFVELAARAVELRP